MQVLKILVLLVWSVPVLAAVPEAMNYQGYLSDQSGQAVDGDFSIEFSIYGSEVGGASLWSDIRDVSVDSGLFSVSLGDAFNSFGGDLFNAPLWLGINVNGDGEMVPRRSLTAVSFAFKAKNSEALDGVSGSQIMAVLDSLQTQIDDISSSIENVPRYYLLGRGAMSTDGAPNFGSLTGYEAADAICKNDFSSEPTAHLCSANEIQRALASNNFDSSNVAGAAWIAFDTFDGFSTTNSQNNNCDSMLHQSGHIARGTTVQIFLNYNSGGENTGDSYNIRHNQACSTSLPLMCCR